MRGRLIFPMVVEIARLDTDATRLAGRYDATFRTMKPGTERVEMAPVRLLAQVEMGAWQAQNQTQAGNIPDSRLTLVFHYEELESKGLVDTNGAALIRVNDRLLGIYSRDGARLEEYLPKEKGGLYAVEVQPAGIGLGGRRNLLVVAFADRPLGLQASPG